MSHLSTFKIQKKKAKDKTFSVLRFENVRVNSSEGLQVTQKAPKPYKAPVSQSNGSGMFAFSQLPDIPEPPNELKCLLEKLKDNENTSKKRRQTRKPTNRTVTKQPKTKLNGFMAYRTYFSQEIYSIKDQRELSSCLGKSWATDKSQLIWQRYATEYNARPVQCSSLSFLEWLLKSTGNESQEEKENIQWRNNVKSGIRIQDIYFNDNGEMMRSEETANIFAQMDKSCDNIITDLDFDAAIASGKAGYPIDPMIQKIQVNKPMHL